MRVAPSKFTFKPAEKLKRRQSPPACPREPGCLAAEAAAGATTATTSPIMSLTMLLAGHILRDGEIVLLILKPSLWFILLTSLHFVAIVVIVALAFAAFGDRVDAKIAHRWIVEWSAFFIAGRLMWATLQWMGRVYLLTDMRIVRLSGIFTPEVFSCPLRRVARIYISRTVRERALRLGTIEIIPADESLPMGNWQTVSRPVETQEIIVAAINKQKPH